MRHEERKTAVLASSIFLLRWAVVDNLTSLWETNAEVKPSDEHELNYLQTEEPLWLPICDLLVLHYVC